MMPASLNYCSDPICIAKFLQGYEGTATASLSSYREERGGGRETAAVADVAFLHMWCVGTLLLACCLRSCLFSVAYIFA